MIRFKIGQKDSIRFHLEKASSTEGGYSEGYTAGYDAGYKVGLEDGTAEGYKSGYDAGRADGYREGYNAGIASQTAILGKAVLGTMKLA